MDLERHMEVMLAYGRKMAQHARAMEEQLLTQDKPMNGTYMQEPPPFLNDEEVKLLKRTLLAKFSEDMQDVFIRRCQRSRLDPFSGQIHPTLRNTKVREGNETKYVPTLVCVTGIYGLCALAVRTGEYDGCEISWAGSDGKWKDEWLQQDFPAAAKCVVYHKHRTKPEVAIARWDSFVQQHWDKENRSWVIAEFWDRLSDFMLAKCAKAAALRGAFPDQLSEIYIREELAGLEAEAVGADEQKIVEGRKREEKVVIPGAKVVESKGERPTPEEALEPAFEEDKRPPTPVQKTRTTVKTLGEKIAAEFPQAKVLSTEEMLKKEAPKAAEAEDNLDLSPAPAEQEAPGVSEPAPAEPPREPPWKTHVIKGVRHVKFQGRKIGDLNAAELAIIETQWLPAIREDWDNASEEQQADAPMFEAAIAFHKMAKPW